MIKQADIVFGNHHVDLRGEVTFVNDFNMSQVKRFYRIKHFDIETIRGWRAHKIEQRWFHVFSGAFSVSLVKIDNWEKPSPELDQQKYVLKSTDISVLHIPAGYASSLQAINENSEMIVFADYLIENAENDNYLYPTNYFIGS